MGVLHADNIVGKCILYKLDVMFIFMYIVCGDRKEDGAQLCETS